MGATHNVNDNGAQHEYTAALRVFSVELRAAELGALLGEPTHGYDLGDVVGRADAVRKSANWTLESGIERTRPLDEHVQVLVAFAESKTRRA